VEESYDAIVESEESVAEDIVRPDLQGSTGFPPPSGTGVGAQNSGFVPPRNPDGNPSQPVPVHPGSPSSGGAVNNSTTPNNNSAPNNLTAATPPARPPSAVFNSQGVGGSFSATTQTAIGFQTRGNMTVQPSSDTSTGTNNVYLGMSLFDRRVVEISHDLFFWWYLLALLLFLLWLAFKLRREWQKRRQRPKR
jgi:hypothetical protein